MSKPLPLTHKSFGGENADQYNALRSALSTAAKDAGHKGEYAEYEWLERVARTSMIVERPTSGDGEEGTMNTLQIAFEPLPASVLFVLGCSWWFLL